MKSRPDDPRHLDVEGFAKGAVALRGDIELRALPRLAETAHADAPPPGAADGDLPAIVSWRARGESRPARGSDAQIWLHLEADATLPMVCQRCLNAVAVPLCVERSFRFVAGEEAAAQLDAEMADDLPVDVLPLPRVLDLHELIEDELLLALPLVPRHVACPDPLPTPANAQPVDERAHPFAGLDVLKRAAPFN